MCVCWCASGRDAIEQAPGWVAAGNGRKIFGEKPKKRGAERNARVSSPTPPQKHAASAPPTRRPAPRRRAIRCDLHRGRVTWRSWRAGRGRPPPPKQKTADHARALSPLPTHRATSISLAPCSNMALMLVGSAFSWSAGAAGAGAGADIWVCVFFKRGQSACVRCARPGPQPCVKREWVTGALYGGAREGARCVWEERGAL